MPIFIKWTLTFLITPAVLLIATAYIPGVFVSSVYIAIIVAIILGFLNIFIRPILLFFSLPITIITFGLFIFVVNALLLWFVSTFISGFSFEGFMPAFITAILISVAHWIGDMVLD